MKVNNYIIIQAYIYHEKISHNTMYITYIVLQKE